MSCTRPCVDAWEIRGGRVVVAELSIRGLTIGSLRVPRAVAPSRQPDVERDVAVIVAEDRPSGELVEVVRSSAGPLLADLRLFDVYRGTPLSPGMRSLAFRLRFAADERTLTEAEVDAAMASVMRALEGRRGPDPGLTSAWAATCAFDRMR